MIVTLDFWNKVEVSKLSIEFSENEDNVFIKVATNNINIFNKKIEVADKEQVKEKLKKILDLAAEVNELYITKDIEGNVEKFKEKSNELMDEIKLV